MRLVVISEAIVPESCAPHDLLGIIGAGQVMDNGTLKNIVLGEEAPFLQEIFGVFNFLFRCQG